MITAKPSPIRSTSLYRSFFLVLFPLLVLSSAGRAGEVAKQAPPPQAEQKPELLAPFGAEILVSEVLLDVLVTDKKGNVILGLGPDDFVVTEDDHKVQITSASFYSNRPFVGGDSPATAESAAPAGATAPAEAPHYFIFFFDDQRGHSADVPGLLQRQVRAGKDAVEWLRAGLAPTDWVAVLGYDNRLKIFQDFSQDRELLATAIQNATLGRDDRGNFPSRRTPAAAGAPVLATGLPVGDALSAETGTVYEGLTLVAAAAAPLRGRKNLLLFTIGFGRMNRFEQYEPDPRYYQPMSESLNDANVAVYTFDLTDTGTLHPFSDAMSQISSDTGGRYFPNVLHFKSPLSEVAKETSGYYLVSYKADHLLGMRGFQKVKVKLVNPELKVTARKGYLFGD